jgi:hypothetical protein
MPQRLARSCAVCLSHTRVVLDQSYRVESHPCRLFAYLRFSPHMQKRKSTRSALWPLPVLVMQISVCATQEEEDHRIHPPSSRRTVQWTIPAAYVGRSLSDRAHTHAHACKQARTHARTHTSVCTGASTEPYAQTQSRHALPVALLLVQQRGCFIQHEAEESGRTLLRGDVCAGLPAIRAFHRWLSWFGSVSVGACLC